ncbi:flagellar biosynthesis-like protein (FlhF) [Maricaulis sp.]|uniref:flagellar biosynthesis protein FlhF n=1 Tax=Maricaulis sp. TaxID=1486257 RepID=UPI0026044D01|nr:flagellar biosynthesis-like protein (FlhF) [Maricaulis sp.]MDF1768979.1 flagellar biosynthesis-like protein (FlhF) [Maricaulis sp.]
MHLKTFAAPSLTQAMAEVRREMGPDAVIIATGDGPDGGVQVRAASEMARIAEPAEQVRDRAIRLAGEADIERGLREDNELDRVIRALGFHRAPGSAAQALIRSAHDLSDGQAVARLAHAIESRYTFQPLPAVPEHAVLFAGTPGVGKTSALAKTAARAITAGAVPTLISCDGERAGANDRLQELARRMGAGFRAVDDPREMIEAVDDIDGPVLIDSPAVNPFELDDLDMTLAFADSANAEILYVFDAGLTPEDAEDAASLFASIGASRCIPVKLDCARRLGAVLGVGETGLAFAQISSTPFIGGGLAPATPLRLARVLIEDRNTHFEEED